MICSLESAFPLTNKLWDILDGLTPEATDEGRCCIKARRLKACVSISKSYTSQHVRTTSMIEGTMLKWTKAQVVERAKTRTGKDSGLPRLLALPQSWNRRSVSSTACGYQGNNDGAACHIAQV